MPRILAPNHSFQRRGSQHSLSSRASRTSRSSLQSEPPLRRSSLSSRGYQNAAYESAFSLRRKGPTRRDSYGVYNGHTNNGTQQTKENAQWDLQVPRQTPKTLSKESLNTTASTQASSQSSSISTLPSTNETSASGLAAAFALMMQQKAGGAVGVGTAPKRRSEPQSVPSSPHPTSTISSSFDPYCMIKEEPDCWGQFVDVQSATEDLERRSRVVRRFPGAPQSLPRGY
mmetsp:Transcript_6834/g.14257  ORF Transcript_6834/g.14257 Transcript_6834/m.14257 type:complete len:229 (+) Transcript_6834:115-801(+)